MNTPGARSFRAYFTAGVTDSERVVASRQLVERMPRDPVAGFLHGRSLQRLERFSDALESFRGLDRTQLDPKLQALLLMAEGHCLFRLGQYQEAKISFWESLNQVGTEARQEQIEDWAAYCDWMTRRKE
jgi:tetratricopeptide (TPR) repeat protein